MLYGMLRILLAFLILTCSASPALAQDEPPPSAVEGQYDFHVVPRQPGERPVVMLRGGRSFELSPEALAELQRLHRAELLPRGRSVRLLLDEHERVVQVQLGQQSGTEPAPGNAALSSPLAVEMDRRIRATPPGALVVVDRGSGPVRWRLQRYDPPDLYLLDPEGRSAGVVVLGLGDIRAYEVLERDAERGGTEGEPASGQAFAELLKVGAALEIDGVRGYVERVTEQAVVLRTAEERSVTIPRAEIRRLQAIDPRALAGPATAPGDARPLQPVLLSVAVEVGQGSLDPAAQLWVVTGTAVHRRPGHLLVGARLRVTARGELLVEPDQLVRIRAQLTADGEDFERLARLGRQFTYQGSYHRAVLLEGRPTVVEVGMQAKSEQLTLPPMLPETPVAWSWRTRLLQPQDLVIEPIYAPEQFVPFGDERAVPALVQAYERGEQSLRRAALAAMVESGNASYLPLLFYHYCLGAAGTSRPLAEAFAQFGRQAQDYLLGVLAKPAAAIAVPDAAGATSPRAMRTETQLVRALELLELLRPEAEIAFRAALPLTQHPDREVQLAARAVFQARRLQAVQWLANALRDEQPGAAQQVLLALEEVHPGTLLELAQALELPKADSHFFDAVLPALPEQERRRQLLGKIVSHQRGRTADEIRTHLAWAQNALQSLAETRRRLQDQAERLAVRWLEAADSPPPRVEARRWKVGALLRAYFLAPEHGELRRQLARLCYTIGLELREQPLLRRGPGEAYGSARSLVPGELLAPHPGGGSVGPWLQVVDAAGLQGWVHSSMVQRLAPTGDYRVVREGRPLEDAIRFLYAARALDANLEAQVAQSLAAIHGARGAEAMAAGDWRLAFEQYRAAASWAPELFRREKLLSFLRANPLVPVLAALCLCVLLFTLLGGRVSPHAPAR
ncbi:MAG: hypothetical protein KatS3mg102_1726 [Planctomycetota bacterium]|nr:MAG: hypothetical protein KatS3mg102_1726 [Planctomycetota bacterium]